MKIYNIKVNGKIFQVEVEAVTEVARKIDAPENAQAVSVGSTAVNAPMAGTILKIVKNVGDTVQKGDVIFVLEAMKLENDIVAPVAGVIKSIDVTKGQAVTLKQKIAVIG